MQFHEENQFESTLDFKLDIEIEDNKLLLNLSYNSRLFSKKRIIKEQDHEPATKKLSDAS